MPEKQGSNREKGIKMMVSSCTQSLLGHCTAGEGGTGMLIWQVHAALLPSMWYLKIIHTHSTLDYRNVRG